MNPRRNLQTRKNRRKRNEQWELLHGAIKEWIFRKIGRDINRFTRKNRVKLVRESSVLASRSLESGELIITFVVEGTP